VNVKLDAVCAVSVAIAPVAWSMTRQTNEAADVKIAEFVNVTLVDAPTAFTVPKTLCHVELTAAPAFVKHGAT
jgi:hypothetical protein